MGKLYGLFYGITCNTQAGSGHYRIYVVYTGWNSFDLTLSHHTSCFGLMRSAINMLDSRRVNNATYLHLCREFCTLVLSFIVQVSVTRKARWGHSLTAVSLGPGLTEVVEFGGSPDPLTESGGRQLKMADTTLLDFSECHTTFIHACAVYVPVCI